MSTDVELWIERLEISDVVRRYFLAMDEFNWTIAASLIHDHITLDAGSLAAEPREVTRREYIDALIARNGGYLTTMHMTSGHVVDVSGDSARVRANFFGAHGVGPEEEDNYFAYGVYNVSLIRSVDGWRINRLEVRPVRLHGGDPGRIAAQAAELFARSTRPGYG